MGGRSLGILAPPCKPEEDMNKPWLIDALKLVAQLAALLAAALAGGALGTAQIAEQVPGVCRLAGLA